ncbi:MAG TPA: exopolyphosphatase [Vicinamibacteria bacterium]|nr:exopolyphosphatase [Vicinamibacteria bacterium]
MRLVTRGDLDGLACALVLTRCEPIDSLELVHPQEITDRRFPVTREDVLANLPYHPACGKWFDNHQLTDRDATPPPRFEGRYARAPSAARVVYDHYLPAHPDLVRFADLIAETDRLDSAQLTLDDVVAPRGYILLGYTLDPRSGLGAFQDYFRRVLDALATLPVEEVLDLPEVRARVDRMRDEDRAFREATLVHSRTHGSVVVTDFRSLDTIPPGNRFLVYTLFPEATVSVRLHWGPGRRQVAVSVGRSVFKRASRVNIGVLLSLYGGGGHAGAGSCMIAPDEVEARLPEIVAALNRP